MTVAATPEPSATDLPLRDAAAGPSSSTTLLTTASAQQQFAELRSRICNALLIVRAVAMVPALVASMSRVPDVGWLPAMTVQVALASIHLAVTLARHRVPYLWRAVYIVVALEVLATSGLLTFGFASAATLNFLSASVLAILLLGPAAGIIVGATGVAIYVATMTDVLQFGRTFPIDLSVITYSTASWFTVGTSLLVAIATLGASLAIMMRFLHRALAQAETDRSRLAGVIDATPYGIVLGTAERFIAVANRRAGEIFGYRPAEMAGMSFDAFVPAEKAPAAGSTGTADTLGVRYGIGRDGVVPVLVTENPLPDGSAFVAGVRDARPDIATLQRLRQADKEEALARLTAGLAHDFNNYLTVILSAVDGAGQDGIAAADRRELLDSAARAASEGSELVRSLLAFARQQPLAPTACDLTRCIADANGLIRTTLGSLAELQIFRPPTPCFVLVDKPLLVSALLNLASNAKAAMPNGGRLVISVRSERPGERMAAGADIAPGECWVIDVTDTGPGMPPELIAHAFDPYFTTRPGGSGLGLSMVASFVRQSNGFCDIRSEPGRGTCITIGLPRLGADALDALAVSEVAMAQQRGSGTVLVVDDQRAIAEAAGRHLEALGYRVITCHTAEEALGAVRREGGSVDLVLADIGLAGLMDGRTLVAKVREEFPRVRGLFMSGSSLGDAAAGPRDVLAKPIRVHELAASVQAALA